MSPLVGAALGAGVGLLVAWPVTDGNLFDPFVPRGPDRQRCGPGIAGDLGPCPPGSPGSPGLRCQPGFLGGTCVGPDYDRNVILARAGAAILGGAMGYLLAGGR